MMKIDFKKTLSKIGGQHTAAGFTLIELMIATVMFSIVLIVILASFLQIGRMYYKGVSVSDTNEAARALVDDIATDIRFSREAPTTFSGGGGFCIGSHRYTYKLNQQVQQGDVVSGVSAQTFNAGVILDTVGTTCGPPSAAIPGTNPEQLLGVNMQLNNLNLTCSSGGCSIAIHVIFYGADNTVFSSSTHPNNTALDHAAAINDPDAYCSGNLLSTQFCSVADFSTNALTGF